MNTSLMPLASQPNMPKMGPLNSENDLKQIGIEDKKNDFTELLADFEKQGKIKNKLFQNKFMEIQGNDKKNPNGQNLNAEKKLLGHEGGNKNNIEKEIKEIPKNIESVNKLESNELFLFQRELANKTGTKNDSIHNFSKVFNVEKKDKKPEIIESSETIGTLENNNKKLESIVKENPVPEGGLKFSTPKELFNWISKVISKSQIKSGETLNLQIRDNILGEFNITAQNAVKGGEVNMSIVSQTKESDEFFKTNEKELLKSLENAGVKIGKIEILSAENSKATSNNQNMSDNKGSLSESINNHFAQKDQLERDSQRRKEIWDRYRDLRES